MPPSPDDAAPGSTGPPDRQTLRLLERQLTAEPLLAETVFDPDAYEPTLLRARLDSGQYPASVPTARLDIRWFTTGDFSLHYVETHDAAERWECRWDRHPNLHTTRVHFHPPPSATDTTPLALPSVHPLEVYSTVLAAVEHRIETLWS